VVRVGEGGEITDRIKVDPHAYALMLGGPERKQLFICTSASHDPAEIQQKSTAKFQIVEVEISGAGMP
jgi:sugar lactone lactonase YvrE